MPSTAKRRSSPKSLPAAIEGLSRLSDVFDLRRQQIAREVGLTDAQWRLLEEIAREDFMPSLFARRRRCSPAAVSRTLRQLQDAGLVRAAIAEADARQRAYSLTARGRRLMERTTESRRRALDAVWRDLPEAEVARFARFSAELAERLEHYADGEARRRGKPSGARQAFADLRQCACEMESSGTCFRRK